MHFGCQSDVWTARRSIGGCKYFRATDAGIFIGIGAKHGAIKGLSDKEFIGAKGTMSPTDVERKDDEIKLWSGWRDSLLCLRLTGEIKKNADRTREVINEI